MTRRLVRILLLILCALMGWVFGYLKVPYIEQNDIFWIGFVGCLGVIAFVIALFRIWKVKKGTNPDETAHSSMNGSMFTSLVNPNFLVSIIMIALICACLFSYNHIRQLNEELKQTQADLEDLKSNTNTEQQRINISLLSDLINDLDSNQNYIHDSPSMNHMIERIVSLSSSFKINRVWDFANKVNVNLSEERGLLLLALLKTKMDSTFFNNIKANVSFYGADLRNADLHGLDLSGIDLKYANLEYANLQGINLNDANLNGANLMGVNLNKATLVGANLISAKLNWAKVNEVNLNHANLDGSDFSNALVQNSNLDNASIIKAILCFAIFKESNLNACLLVGSNMSNANFSNAILTNSHIDETNLGNTILDNILIQENWLKKLKENNNSGVNTILEKYYMIRARNYKQDTNIYKLVPK